MKERVKTCGEILLLNYRQNPTTVFQIMEIENAECKSTAMKLLRCS